MTPGMALEMIDVARHYGDVVAVRDVTLRVRAGEILCVLGPNGAGKTTTVKMASTLLAPTSGTIRVGGVDAVRNPRKARAHLGLALGGDRGFYMRATVLDNLRFFAELKGAGGRRRDSSIQETLDRLGLGDKATKRVEELSRGMRQRLHIARALIGEPALILLDEPSSGLDPENAKGLRDLVATLRSNGAAILLTTHHMQEAEELANRIVVLDRGTVAVEGTTATIAEAAGITQVSTFRASSVPAEFVTRIASDTVGVIDVLAEERNGAWTIDVMWSVPSADNESILQILGGSASHIVTRAATLEEAYLGYLERRRSRVAAQS